MSDGQLKPGVTIGHYQVLSRADAAEPASSYRAIDRDSTRVVLITLFPPMESSDESAFDRQAARLMSLQHPNIAAVLGFGVEGRMPYLISDVPDGTSLETAAAGSERMSASRLSVLRQVAAALDFAHAAEVLHGDLRPDSVVLDAQGHATLRGLGVAPLLEASGQALPSTPYRAPEQSRSQQPTAAADRYSFAALASTLLQKVAAGDGGSQAEFEAVLLRGLSADPAARWPSCTAMVEALVAALRPPAQPAKAGATSRRGLWIALSIVAMFAVLALVLALIRPPSEPAPAAGAPATMALSRNAVTAGSSLVVTASNLPAHQSGTIQLESTIHQLAVFQADATGSFSVSVTIPAGTSSGDHVLSSCWNNACPLRETVTITELSSPTPTPSPTGSATPAPSTSPSATPSATSVASASTSP